MMKLYRQLSDNTLRLLTYEGDAEAKAELQRRIREAAAKLQKEKGKKK